MHHQVFCFVGRRFFIFPWDLLAIFLLIYFAQMIVNNLLYHFSNFRMGVVHPSKGERQLKFFSGHLNLINVARNLLHEFQYQIFILFQTELQKPAIKRNCFKKSFLKIRYCVAWYQDFQNFKVAGMDIGIFYEITAEILQKSHFLLHRLICEPFVFKLNVLFGLSESVATQLI